MLLRPSNLARLGVPAGFSTRQGGVSAPPFDTLNFGNPGELPPGVSRDPAANIAENFRRVAHELGCPGRAIIQVHQVHGSAVHVHEPAASDGTSTGTAWERTITGADPKADAIVTRDAGALIAIRVADCTPILLTSADGTIVAAVHAGWRGVIAGVVVEAVRTMRVHGATQIHAAIGPCIGPDQFEVGPEVVAEFRRVFGAAAPVRERPEGKGDVDLQAALALQLHAEGIDDVETLRHCTASHATRFFSHRRDRGVTGRMIGVIGPRAAQ